MDVKFRILINCIVLIVFAKISYQQQWQGQWVKTQDGDTVVATVAPGSGNFNFRPDGPDGPIRLNSGGGGGGAQGWRDRTDDPGRNPQDLNNRFRNSSSPMRDMMRGMIGRAGDAGINPQNLNNIFKNSSSPMRDMMRGIIGKAQKTGSKLLSALKDSNGTLLISRQARQFVPSACAQEMLQVQTDCFSKNGYSMDTFFHNLRNGSLSPNDPNNVVDSLKDQICGKRQDILDCVIPSVMNKRDKPPCLDVHDYNYAQEMALKGVRIIQDICKAGLLPPPPICVPLVNREMQRCYTKVGFSPDMFISDDRDVEGAVIGKDMDAANTFCSSRRELYQCMRLVMKNCPDAEEYLMMTGHDQTAIETSIDVLCDNKNVYVDGLNCFQTPSETVHNCIDVMSSQMLDLDARQMWKNLNKDEYYREFCRIRVQHMECDTTAWKESCHKVTVGLKNEFQCAMLPGVCHNITEIDDILHQKVCEKGAFLQPLRAPYSSGNHVSSSILSFILTIGLSVALILF